MAIEQKHINPRRLRWAVGFLLGLGIVVLPGLNLWFWLHGERPGEARHLPLVVGMLIAISLYAWWAANASERAMIEAKGLSAPSVESARGALIAYMGSANLIAIGGFAATQEAGWAWGGAFYMAYVLLVASALVRYRRRTARTEEDH